MCEDLYPGFRFFAYDNYRLFKGIVFDGKQSDRTEMDVEEAVLNDEEIQLSVKVWSKNEKGFRVNHYAADITLLKTLPDAPVVDGLVLNRGTVGFDDSADSFSDSSSNSNVYKNGTLFHGPCFQSIKETVSDSEHELTLRCHVPNVSSEQQGQFAVNSTNPFVDDVLYQSMLVWVRNHTGKGSLPSSAKRCEQFSSIPLDSEFYVSLDVVSSKANAMIANITLHNADGIVYIRMEEASVTISEALNPLFLQNRVIEHEETGKVSA